MRAKLKEDLAATFHKVLWLLVVILLLSYLFSMALGVYLVFFLPPGIEVATRQVVVLPLSFFMVVNFGIPLGVSAGIFFAVLWLLFAGALLLAWFDKPSFPSFSGNLTVGRPDLAHLNYLALMPQLASVVFVIVIIIQSLQESVGVPTGGLPPEPPVLQFLSVSYAPIIEELSYRITTIGFFGGLFLLAKARRLRLGGGRRSRARVLLLTMWKPEAAKESLGFPRIQTHGVIRGISKLEWLLLILSSVAFGAAHYLAGGGWDVGKISTAAISGLAMGLVYLRYGAYAPILLHWFFNYYFGAFDLASQLNLKGLGPMSDGVQLFNVGVGALLIVVWIGFSIERIWHLKLQRRQTQEERADEIPNVS